jgi:cell shape-determining protein MreC
MEKKRDRGLLTGIIAQEVKVVLPELVSADENGILAVNYTGLIPHLIEAVKELDQKTSEIAELKKELTEVKQLNKRMTEMEASLKTLLTGNTSATGKPHTK